MAAANPDIVVNNLTGSNTAASGAPSGFGPFSAAATCHTNGIASTVIQWPANPLAGVPTDGSAVIFLDRTGAGNPREFSKITARDANTVTVEDAFTIAAGSPLNCAVGGKRFDLVRPPPAFFFNSFFSANAKPGWSYAIEATGVDYSMGNTAFGPNNATYPRIWIRGTGGRPTLRWGVNVGLAEFPMTWFENLRLVTNSVATGIEAIQTADNMVLKDMLVEGWQNFDSGGISRSLMAYRIEVKNNTVSGFNSTDALLLAGYLHDNTGTGFSSSLGTALYVISAANTVGIGDVSGAFHVTTYGNSSHGISTTDIAGYAMSGVLSTNNGGFGFASSGSASATNGIGRLVDRNAFFSNTAGTYSSAPVGPNDTTGVDPQYTSAAGQNWQMLQASGLQDRGWPVSTLVVGIGTTTVTRTEPGAPQGALGGGGGGGCCLIK